MEVFSVCVYVIFRVCVVKNKHVNTSLLWHKFLQVHHKFGLCHLFVHNFKNTSPGFGKLISTA